MTIDRRTFLGSLGAALALVARPADALSARAPQRKLGRIGVQLYTVRDAMQRDVAATLQRVARIGYREVEFAGYFGRSPKEIRALLDANGLTAPSTHLGYETLGADWERTLADARAIGHEWVTIPWLPEEARRTLDDWKHVADRFNAAAKQARAAGLRFAYHNHDMEFTPVGGRLPYDVLLEATDPSLVDFEMDLYWAVKAGADPLAYFAKHPHRFKLVHVKDSLGAPAHTMTDVGKGTIDFRRIFRRSAEAGIRHYFVEHDEPRDPFASITNSYRYLAALEF